MSVSISRRRFSGLALACAVAAPYVARAQGKGDRIRFCWTNTVTVSAQLQHTLMNTDIPARHGLDIEMIQFAGSSLINEALASNAADIGSVADFSAVMMMAAGIPIHTVAHQSSFRSAVLATEKSGITDLSQLKGKAVYGLFGITAYLNAQEAVRGAGLTPGKDVNFVNMGTAELADAVRAQRIDAFFMWDPWVSFFEQQGFASVISQNVTPAMVLEARQEFTREKADVLQRFLRAHSEALFFASRNRDLTNQWFRSRDPAKGIPAEVIEKASEFDPQWSAASFTDIKTEISPTGIANMERMARWGFEEKLLPRLPEVRASVNLEIARAADAQAASTPFDPAGVKVLV